MFRSLKFYLLAAIILAGGAGLLAQTICQIGNLNDPVSQPVPGIVQGDQVFAYLVHPVEQCDCPEEFVQLQNLNMWLEFDASMVPVNFTVRPGLRPAVFDFNLDQWVPGGYFYEGQPFDIFVRDAGPFLLQVPAIAARWINVHDYFFLTLTFETDVVANLLGDMQDEPGINYVSPDGVQWFDLFDPDKTSGGKTIIWGDVLCSVPDATHVPQPTDGPRLEEPRPNPFNPRTSVALVMDQPGRVKLTVHDSRGRLVKVLADEQRGIGTWHFEWNGTDTAGRRAPAGLYLLRAETAAGVTVRKAVMVK